MLKPHTLCFVYVVWCMVYGSYINKSHHIVIWSQIYISIFTMPNKSSKFHTHWWDDDLPIWYISLVFRSSESNIPIEYKMFIYIVSNQSEIVKIFWDMQDVTRPENELYYLHVKCKSYVDVHVLNTVIRITKNIVLLLWKVKTADHPWYVYWLSIESILLFEILSIKLNKRKSCMYSDAFRISNFHYINIATHAYVTKYWAETNEGNFHSNFDNYFESNNVMNS